MENELESIFVIVLKYLKFYNTYQELHVDPLYNIQHYHNIQIHIFIYFFFLTTSYIWTNSSHDSLKTITKVGNGQWQEVCYIFYCQRMSFNYSYQILLSYFFPTNCLLISIFYASFRPINADCFLGVIFLYFL